MSTSAIRAVDPAGSPFRTRPWTRMPAEGDDGLFTQSWFALAFSHELAPGQIIGRDFLDGRIILYRGESGQVTAMGAYCAHVGADLSLGTVIGDGLRCPFHHWQYDATGACVRTGVGDAPPKDAKLFRFPTQEKLGIIWVFNGETPLFDVPSFPYPEDEIEIGIPYPMQVLNCDPWVFCANTPDMQHFKFVHNMKFDNEDPHDLVEWDPHGFVYTYPGVDPSPTGPLKVTTTLAIRGTSIFYRSQMHGDFWRGSLTGFGMPRPGQLQVFAINAVRKGPKAKEELETSNAASRRILSEDKEIMNTIHYRIGQLTKGDTTLSKFLTYLRRYPRAHPSADYIR